MPLLIANMVPAGGHPLKVDQVEKAIQRAGSLYLRAVQAFGADPAVAVAVWTAVEALAVLSLMASVSVLVSVDVMSVWLAGSPVVVERLQRALDSQTRQIRCFESQEAKVAVSWMVWRHFRPS